MKVPFSFLKHYHVSGKDSKQRESQKALLFPPDPNPSGLARASSERNWLLRVSGAGREHHEQSRRRQDQQSGCGNHNQAGCGHHEQAGEQRMRPSRPSRARPSMKNNVNVLLKIMLRCS
jgi:hypothetical protein